MMPDTRVCQNCHQPFIIEPDDFDFYKKIDVPEPTWCYRCRLQRQISWRNERTLYHRKCALTGKDIISVFDPSGPYTVYDRDAWWSDAWDSTQYGAPYDFSKPFFSQYRKLLETVPLPALFNSFCVKSEYTNHVGYLKNCYLIFASWRCEDTAYATQVSDTKDSWDMVNVTNCELGYELLKGIKIYKSAYLENCENCADSAFLFDCKGCTDCFCSTSLRNKSHYFFNEPLSKEEYAEKLKEFNLGSFRQVEKVKEKFEAMKLKAVRRFAVFSNTKNCTGDFLSQAENCKHCFGLRENIKDCKYCINGGYGMFQVYDSYGAGGNCELQYETVDSGVSSSGFRFGLVLYAGRDVRYSYNCHACTSCFACIGLRNKQYCILNKQYTPEKYKELVARIREHMNTMPYIDAKGRIYKYGEFFPPELSPFAYNETIAQEYFPLTKAQAIEEGYAWRDPDIKEYKVTKTPDSLPDHIKDVPDSITSEVIGCTHNGTCNDQCTTAFKIIPEELAFYRRMNLPLPRLCPNCRHYARFMRQNPVQLQVRQCDCSGAASKTGIYKNNSGHFHDSRKCPKTFETSYLFGSREAVYCEQCYNSEVV